MMMLCEDWVLDACAGELSALAAAIERKFAEREEFELAAHWRDVAASFVVRHCCYNYGEPLVVEHEHALAASDTLITAVIELPGTVRCHLVDRRTGEVAYLFGEDWRLDFHYEKGEVAEMKKLRLFQEQ